MENPLLKHLETPNGTIVPFDHIKSEHFEEAFTATFQSAKQNLDSLINDTAPPTFNNTIEAIEYYADDLLRIRLIFDKYYEGHTDPEIHRVGQIFLPKFAEINNDVFLNETLFAKAQYVYEHELDILEGEQKRLLNRTYQKFVRLGAKLSSEDKETLRAYDNELTLLCHQFSKNLLAATNDFTLVIEDEHDLSGLPERVREMAKEEAVSRGNPNAWVFTLKYPSYGPFMQYADNGELRKKMAIAFSQRGMKTPYDNREIFLKIAKLRKQRAALLGHSSHARYVLDDRMAKKTEIVESFFNVLVQKARPSTERDFEDLRVYKEKLTGDSVLNAWDVAYFSEKLLHERFNFNEEEFRPYLELKSVLAGLFETVNRLYGIVVQERNGIPTYHPDVIVYELMNADKTSIGLLYMDIYPRDSKRQGGWISELVTQQKRGDTTVKPQSIIVCNFTKPTSSTPALISLFEAATLFHEFGHALHMLLSDCTYVSLSGANVLWDFVELPSQLLESWFDEKETLELFARHYVTGKSLPASLLESKLKADAFQVGWKLLSQIGSSVLDLAWHSETVDTVTDVEAFESSVRKPYVMFPHYPGTSSTTSFKHIVDSGYDAGYYSYLWAEVLAADAFEYFKDQGLFSKEVAKKFREHVLTKGNTEEPMDLYRKFRGREPDPRALLRWRKLE